MPFIKESEALDKDGKRIDLYFFGAPMFHEDWHEVEDNGLVLVATPEQQGGDSFVFSKPEDKEKALWWLED